MSNVLSIVLCRIQEKGASAENALQMAAKDGGHENVIGDRGIHWRGVRGEGDLLYAGVLRKRYSLPGGAGEGDVYMTVCYIPSPRTPRQ